MIWMHKITAGHLKPLEPDRKVFGSEEDGYYIITRYMYGSHWMMPAIDACARIHGSIESILTHEAEALSKNTNAWRYARDIWPDHYAEVEMRSPCCSKQIDSSRGDGVMIGSCRACGKSVVRLNPETGTQEWLDGKSPWTIEPLRPVDVVA